LKKKISPGFFLILILIEFHQVGDGKLGFPLPFIIMGSLLLLAVPFALMALWNHDFTHRLHHFDFDISDTHTKAGLISLLRIPAILLYIFAVITTSMCIGFLAAVRLITFPLSL